MADEERDLSVKVYSYFCACVLSKEGWFRVLQIYEGVTKVWEVRMSGITF